MITMENAIEESLKMKEQRLRINIDTIKNDLSRADVRILDYKNGNVGNLEAQFLAARFFINKSVETVELQNNKIGDEGIKMLAEALKNQTRVKVIALNENLFSEIGILALADLKKNRPDIDIRGVNLSEERILTIRQMLRKKSLHFRSDLANQRDGGTGESTGRPHWSTRVHIEKSTVVEREL